MSRRVAIVVPRVGVGLAGGAEALARGVADEGRRRGWEVELWTTRARDHHRWENELPAGASDVGGVTIRRFDVDVPDRAAMRAWQRRLATAGQLPEGEQYRWLEIGPHSPALYAHVATHAAGLDALLLLPFALPLIQMAAWAAPEHALFWPCLHDEPYAYLAPTRLLVESVRGLLFNSPEEGALAARLFRLPPRTAVVGVGLPDREPSPPVDGGRPYLLYIGRLEEGKNLLPLYAAMRAYHERGGAARLVVVGSGTLQPPEQPPFEWRGFVSDEEKARLCAGALAICQPSLNESFSITIMEGWQAGRPALVHRHCEVTRGHVARSLGGLWFHDRESFAATVDWLLRHPAEAARMGANGREYVRRNYRWPLVVDRLERALTAWGAA